MNRWLFSALSAVFVAAAAMAAQPPEPAFGGSGPAQLALVVDSGGLPDIGVEAKDVAAIVGGLLTFLGVAFATSEVRRRRVAKVIRFAYLLVEECWNEGLRAPGMDKAVYGLKMADEWMIKHDWRPLREDEKERVVLGFKALHGETKVVKKLHGASSSNGAPPPSGTAVAVLACLLLGASSGCAHPLHPRRSPTGSLEAPAPAPFAFGASAARRRAG